MPDRFTCKAKKVLFIIRDSSKEKKGLEKFLKKDLEDLWEASWKEN